MGCNGLLNLKQTRYGNAHLSVPSEGYSRPFPIISIDSKPEIKVEVKQEYEENYFSDAGCSFDTSLVPYSCDDEIDVKDEPCDFDEDCKQSVKLEIKEEFPLMFCTTQMGMAMSNEERLRRKRNAERKRRENRRAKAETKAEDQLKRKLRYLAAKQQKKIKTIADMNENSKTRQRKQWKENSARYYQRKKQLAVALNGTS
ncbi:uncharacterized protein [Halyomorpha halys]|uniref:uncharacterized protein isoform X3 n=1 Tax=Halyomorpha halys TaxID=286706 RepID=UPI0006D4C75A|nr:uncharacterized protein LOC106680118 isoform X3 [Halyomorpha halys]